MLGEQLLIPSVFSAGILSFFAPCTFPLIPVYIGLLADHDDRFKTIHVFGKNIHTGSLIKTTMFLLGISTAFVVLGFGAGALGAVLYSDWILIAGGLIVIALGIHQMDLIHIPKLERYATFKFKNRSSKLFGTFLMGMTFSFGWTPCVGPVLGAVLLTSASSGQALYGGFLMIIYSIGLMIPFLVMALASSVMIAQFERIEKHLVTIKRVGGALIILMGILLMSNQLTSITIFIEKLIR